MKKMKFTFKKDVPEGPYNSFEMGSTDIKLKKKVVGHISERRPDYQWTVSFAIKKEKTKQKPAPFKWIKLIHPFESEKRARKFCQDHADEIINKYDLYSFED